MTRRPQEEVLDPDGARVAWSRRAFLRLMGASTALAGGVACENPKDVIVPYVRQPEDVVPGRAKTYATAMELGGAAIGILAESHEGRPTKIEGNPRHPASLGATDVLSQAAILDLYDPGRAKAVHERGEPRPFSTFVTALRRAAGARPGGEGLFLVLGPTGSPTTEAMLARVREAYPRATVSFFAPRAPVARWTDARAAFGRVLEAQTDPWKADVVVSIGADVLAARPENVRLARGIIDRRRLRAPSDDMSRLYVAETAMTVTGATADRRVAVRPSELAAMAAGLLGAIVRAGARGGAPEDVRARLEKLVGPRAEWLDEAARDLVGRAPRGLVYVGDDVGSPGPLLGHAIHALLGAVGATVTYTRSPVLEAGEPSHGLSALAAAIDEARVDALVVFGENLAYGAPVDLEMPRRLRAVPLSAYVGERPDETALASRWQLAGRHFLEAWGDARAADGTTSIVQPLIEPLHGGRTTAEVLAALLGARAPDAHAIVRELWSARGLGAEHDWRQALATGVVPGSALPAERASIDWGRVASEAERAIARASAPAEVPGALEIAFAPDPKVDDGRFASNGWLQELPHPVTKLTWGNALEVSPKTARDLGVETNRVVRLDAAGRTLEVPVIVSPGHADGAATLSLGYGRAVGAGVGDGVGANAYALRTTTSLERTSALITRTGDEHELATTQRHASLHDRDMVRTASLARFRENPAFATEHDKPKRTLYLLRGAAEQQWAMTIDLMACTGCSACVVACQAENNVPVVGREGVLNGREMHWLRIDRYVHGPEAAPRVEMQPMLCQHCETAPCEYVCPVGATNHSEDGLNQMVYPRCVGTRFCSNNCPYKVRRFNWFNYSRDTPDLLALAHNPHVTVRDRGVMEKCTFCVQRIREAEREAHIAHRDLDAREVVTACAQACPTRAIQFGSLTAKGSDVATARKDPRSYDVLGHLGTRPRVTYMARVRNDDDVEEIAPK